MFGLGMNNNGTGMVLASVALADHPLVMLPIIFYNLVQHLIAAIVDYLRTGRSLRSSRFRPYGQPEQSPSSWWTDADTPKRRSHEDFTPIRFGTREKCPTYARRLTHLRGK